jgi:group I intron endonuclease
MSEQKQFFIYIITNNITNKVYIGRTHATIYKRWLVHKTHAKNYLKYPRCGRTYFHNAIRKYGWQNFSVKQCDVALSFDHMVWLEMFYIKYFNSNNPKYGYNIIGNTFDEERMVNSLGILKDNARRKHKLQSAKGIFYDKKRKVWGMNFSYLGKKIKKRCSGKEQAYEWRDKLSLYFFGEDAVLHDERHRNSFSQTELQKHYEEMYGEKIKTNTYKGVYEHKKFNTYYVNIRDEKNNTCYLGTYDNKECAAQTYDKVAVYLNKNDLNMPELVNKNYYKEGEKIYMLYKDKVCRITRKEKSSQYNGVNRRSVKTWEMSLVVNGNRIREVYKDEKSAALAHDSYIIKNGMDLRRLNFKNN